MARQLITESDIRGAIAAGARRIDVAPDAIVTPLARELAAAHGIALEPARTTKAGSPMTAVQSKKEETPSAGGEGVVAFGADHGGFQLKGLLMKHAQSLGYSVLDLGTSTEEPCDYPDFAYAVAKAVASGEAWRGVMIDGAGIGSCVVANKIPGIRAACCHNEFVARNAREHNDTNVLTLGSRVTGSEVCKEILRVWLGTMFAGGRHQGRVDKMRDVERRYLK
jgi:ribose 5-phosphate isomerase B